MSMITVDRFTVTPFLAWVGKWYLRLFGWEIRGTRPPISKYVAILAHHTSLWDGPLLIAMSFYFQIPAYWIAKDSLFRGPTGPLLRRFGGVPINRSSSQNIVEQVIQIFEKNDEFVLALAPEGTREATTCWKTGFYHMAQGAKVPIAMVYIDYEKKICGMGPLIDPTGDMIADLKEIAVFYEDVKGKHPGRQGTVVLEASE